TWTTVASMPTVRWGLTAVAGPDGRIYAIGGDNASRGHHVSAVEAYTPSTNAWIKVTNMPTGRFAPAASVGPDGRIYVIGGSSDFGVYNTTVQAYGPVVSLTPK